MVEFRKPSEPLSLEQVAAKNRHFDVARERAKAQAVQEEAVADLYDEDD